MWTMVWLLMDQVNESVTGNVDYGMVVDGLGIDGSMTGNVDYGMAVNGLRY